MQVLPQYAPTHHVLVDAYMPAYELYIACLRRQFFPPSNEDSPSVPSRHLRVISNKERNFVLAQAL